MVAEGAGGTKLHCVGLESGTQVQLATTGSMAGAPVNVAGAMDKRSRPTPPSPQQRRLTIKPRGATIIQFFCSQVFSSSGFLPSGPLLPVAPAPPPCCCWPAPGVWPAVLAGVSSGTPSLEAPAAPGVAAVSSGSTSGAAAGRRTPSCCESGSAGGVGVVPPPRRQGAATEMAATWPP